MDPISLIEAQPLVDIGFLVILPLLGFLKIGFGQSKVLLEFERLASSHEGLVEEIFAFGLLFVKAFIVLDDPGAIVDGLLHVLKFDACKRSVCVEGQKVLLVLQAISIMLPG